MNKLHNTPLAVSKTMNRSTCIIIYTLVNIQKKENKIMLVGLRGAIRNF